MLTDIFDEYLYHSGVDGMKWYVHRFGNWERHAKYANGQPNPDTRIKRNVFISGTSKLKLEDSEFYRKKLPREVRKKVDEYIKNKDHIIIGDAPGIDTEVQRYLANKGYKDVTVYTIGKHPRAYFDEDKSLGWTVKKVKSATGDQADKDKAMSDDADIGFAVTIEDGAKATRNNVKRMEDDGKNVEVFSLYKNRKDAWEKSNKKKVSLKEEMMDDKITAYQRSPNKDILHSGVDGMKWYIHKFGNWERHAKYANGQPNPETAGSRGPYSSSAARDARLAKKAAKKARKEAKNKELRDKLLGVEAERPRKELEGKTSEELKELTQRLKIENDYIAAIKQAKQLDREIASMTGSEGLIKEYEKKLAKKLGVASGAVGNLVMYRSLVEIFGEENAKILMGQKPGSGKGDKNKKKDDDELKKHPFSYYKELGVEDAKKDLAKREGYRETIDYWREKHPDKSDLADELYKKKKPKDEDEQTNSGGNQQPQQTTPRQEEQEVDPDLSGDGYVDESFYRSPISDYYSRGSSNNYSDIYDYSYTNSASDRSVKTRNTEDGTDYYDRDFSGYGYDNGSSDKYKYFGPRQKRVTSIKTPKKITSRSKRKR